MKSMRLGTVVSFLAAMMFGGLAAAKSKPIDCRKAHTPVDRELCSSPADVALDREIAALYDRGLAEFGPQERHALAQSQVKFVRARGKCEWAAHQSAHPGTAVGECVRGKMEERVRYLRRAVDRGGSDHWNRWTRRGEGAYAPACRGFDRHRYRFCGTIAGRR